MQWLKVRGFEIRGQGRPRHWFASIQGDIARSAVGSRGNELGAEPLAIPK